MTDLPVIPPSLLPADGRFGAGPSRVRAEQVAALVRGATTVLGTSHRQAPVKELVARVQDRMARFLRLPEGYEMVVGMGGASAFWDSAAFGLVSVLVSGWVKMSKASACSASPASTAVASSKAR